MLSSRNRASDSAPLSGPGLTLLSRRDPCGMAAMLQALQRRTGVESPGAQALCVGHIHPMRLHLRQHTDSLAGEAERTPSLLSRAPDTEAWCGCNIPYVFRCVSIGRREPNFCWAKIQQLAGLFLGQRISHTTLSGRPPQRGSIVEHVVRYLADAQIADRLNDPPVAPL